MAKRIIRDPGVCERTGFAKRTLYQEVAADRFPKPTPLTARTVGWLEEDVDSWIEAKIAAAKGKAE